MMLHQDASTHEWVAEKRRAGIADMDAANEFLKGFWPRFNGSLGKEPMEGESRFSPLVPSMKAKLADVLCLKAERTVDSDNCVACKGRAGHFACYENRTLHLLPTEPSCTLERKSLSY